MMDNSMCTHMLNAAKYSCARPDFSLVTSSANRRHSDWQCSRTVVDKNWHHVLCSLPSSTVHTRYWESLLRRSRRMDWNSIFELTGPNPMRWLQDSPVHLLPGPKGVQGISDSAPHFCLSRSCIMFRHNGCHVRDSRDQVIWHAGSRTINLRADENKHGQNLYKMHCQDEVNPSPFLVALLENLKGIRRFDNKRCCPQKARQGRMHK